MRLGRLARAFLLFLFSLSAAPGIADTLHVIALRHRPASELQPLIEPLLRPEEGISGSGFQLILRASESRREEIERLVAKLDVAARQLTVTVRHSVARDERRSRDAVSGEVGVGDRGRIIIPDAADGRRRTSERDELRYRFERRESNTDTQQTQTLRVQDGQHAFIRIGQSVPTVERVLTLTGRRRAVLAEGVRYEDFVSGFDVLPRVRGDTVVLEITPKLTNPGRTAAGTYRFQELQTTVTARLGEWIDLGGVIGQSSEVNRAILQSATSRSGESVSIALKVEQQ